MAEEIVKTGIAALIAAYESCLGIHICINDFAGNCLDEIPRSNQYHDNPHCNFVKNLDASETRMRCAAFDNSAIPMQLRLSGRGVWKLCHGGLLEYVAGLYDGEVMTGKISFGQFRPATGGDVLPPRCQQSATPLPREKLDRGMWNLLPAPDAKKREALELVFENLAESLSRLLSKQAPGKCESTSRRETIDYFMRRKLGTAAELADLAAFLGLSVSRTGAVVRELYRMSFAELLRFHRMEYARMLLRNTTLPVVRIAGLCGYSDPAYFHRCFRKSNGKSALEYRRGM